MPWSKEVVAEQTAQCYEMRLKGFTIRQIVKQTGLSTGTVVNRIQKAMTDRVAPLAEEYRAITIDRLERMITKAEHDYDTLSDPVLKQKAQEQVRKLSMDLYEVTGLKQYKIEFKDVTDANLGAAADTIEFLESLLGFQDSSIAKVSDDNSTA